jgi:energy-coupling factor transporter ATP-binding protein EcfA2
VSFDAFASSIITFLATATSEPEAAGRLPEFVDKFLKDSPWGTIVGLFAVLAVVLSWLVKQTEMLQKLIEGWQKITATFRKESTPQATDVKKKLLRAIKGEVTRRRRGSLHNLVMIDLRFQEEPHQVGHHQLPELAPEPESQENQILLANDSSDETSEATRKVIDVFYRVDVGGKLLILGETGSGKTTELLQLSEYFIRQSENSDNAPIPIIVELSTWKNDRQPIDKWLITQLRENYPFVPKSISEKWLNDQDLLLLLDGLDELGAIRQIKCIQAINRFLLETAYPYIVVCCRREEYEEGKIKLDQLNNAICLKPLVGPQIQKYLQDVGRFNLWQAIFQEPEQKELAKSPFLLSILVTAYQGRPIKNWQELFDSYIEHRITQPIQRQIYTMGKQPSHEKTRHYLKVLARKLKAQSETEFSLEKIQQNWLETFGQRFLSGAIDALVISLPLLIIFGAFTLVFWLSGVRISEPSNWSFEGIIFGLTGGLISGLLDGIINCFIYKIYSIRLDGKIQISISNFLHQSIFRTIGELVGKLTVALIFALIFGLITGLNFNLLRTFGKNGFYLGMISGFLLGINDWLVRVFGSKTHTQSRFGSEVWISARSVGILTGMTIFLSTLLFPTAHKLIFKHFLNTSLSYLDDVLILLFLIFTSVWMSYEKVSALKAYAQYFARRVVLWQSGLVPWNYRQFLEYASDLRFIQRVGGRYRFIHDLLREHFAAMRE